MNIIQPTVGRIVWYWPTAYDLAQGMFAYPGSDQPMAATVAFVHSDRMVNLSVVDHNGQPIDKRSVTLLQEGDVVRDHAGYAEWMPFQKGQAAKTDTAQHGALDSLLNARIPILDQITELCYAIEKCGASPELTDAVTKAGALREPVSELVRQAVALGVGAGIVGVNCSTSTGERGNEVSITVPPMAKQGEIPAKSEAECAECPECAALQAGGVDDGLSPFCCTLEGLLTSAKILTQVAATLYGLGGDRARAVAGRCMDQVELILDTFPAVGAAGE